MSGGWLGSSKEGAEGGRIRNLVFEMDWGEFEEEYFWLGFGIAFR